MSYRRSTTVAGNVAAPGSNLFVLQRNGFAAA
jgi:hypothetical protein